jgi:hypothetical protein
MLRAIMSQASYEEGAETILIRVQSSDWKSRAPEMGEDIVQTIWKHIEVHKRTG